MLAPLSQTSGGVGTTRPSGQRCRRFGRDPCSVSRVATFLAMGTLKANPRVSPTSPRIGFLHPLSPRTLVRFGCKPGFPARRWYSTHLFALFCTENHGTILPPTPAVQSPSSSSSLQLYARVAAVVVVDSLIGAWRFPPHHTPYVLCAADSCASLLHVHRLR